MVGICDRRCSTVQSTAPRAGQKGRSVRLEVMVEVITLETMVMWKGARIWVKLVPQVATQVVREEARV